MSLLNSNFNQWSYMALNPFSIKSIVFYSFLHKTLLRLVCLILVKFKAIYLLYLSIILPL